ncbi:glycosyltransferase [Pseudomonas sp. LMG 31766]|uniref:Glycosyltransferase family 2 protein n=1 Tax=Pseudomonas chaetocerotis TaxID=2758695 RepID=A0A931CZ08_9PSED|nr:glycosyltransferase family 2 protein [Pseudomonas chaetocerotis]MBZ9664912.1 glycosyltransferase [Pseudomonas chaetocerotis]
MMPNDSSDKSQRSMASVSVIIPCFRCATTISRAVNSVVCQSLLPLEIILVDDYSQDDTLKVLYSLQARLGADWIKVCALPENAGPGTARNEGWKLAQGRYVAFLDSDDRWHPQKIELQYNWMEHHPNVALIGHLMAVDDGGDDPLLENSTVLPVQISCRKLLASNRFSTPTVMLRSDIAQRFAYGERYCEDYRLWLHVCFFSGECYLFERVLAYMYKAPYGAAGLSGRLWEMEKGEVASYWSIYRGGGINILSMGFWVGLSIVKFIRRVFLVRFRRRAQ